MNLYELKQGVDRAIESAKEHGDTPDKITVSLQIDDTKGDAVWTDEGVELIYDNDCQASGCVLLGFDRPRKKLVR